MILNRIRRVTRDGRWIPEIDGLRFVAIASVVLFHLLGELQNRSGRILPVEARYAGVFGVVANGGRGVSLFFIISGFVLALPFARHFFKASRPVSLRKYFLRRVTRLEPPYLLSVLLFLALMAVYTHGLGPELLRHAAFTAVYLHSLRYGTMTPVNSVSWSLEVEIQFYLAAPLFMQLFRLRRTGLRRACMAALILGISLAQMPIGLQEAGTDPSHRAALSILYYAQFFLMGLLLADFYIVDGDRIRPSLLWDGAGVAGLTFSFGAAPTFANTHIVMPWAMALLFLAALRGVALRKFFANAWIATVGGMCYSIYLIHFQMIAVFFKVTRRCIVPGFDFLANYALQILVTLVPVLLIAAAFYLLIERPCMDPNWPSRFWHWITGRSRFEALAFDSGDVSA